MKYVCELENIIKMTQISRPSLSQQFGIKLKDFESEDCFAVFQKGKNFILLLPTYCTKMHEWLSDIKKLQTLSIQLKSIL
jgi:hypothetical protein